MRTFWGACERDELLRKMDLRTCREVVAHMCDLCGLRGDRFDPLRMRVSNRIDGDSRKEIKVFVAIDVPYVHALPMVEDTQRRAEDVHVHIVVFIEEPMVLRQCVVASGGTTMATIVTGGRVHLLVAVVHIIDVVHVIPPISTVFIVHMRSSFPIPRLVRPSCRCLRW